MLKKFIIEKNRLYDLYIIKNYRRQEVANIYGCSDVLIKQYLKKFNIKKSKKLESKNKEKKVTINCLCCNKKFNVVNFRSFGKWKLKFCSHKCSSDYRYLGENHKRKVRNSVAATRRCKIKQASVILSKKEKQLIREFYINCPIGYEVDHIIPISKGGKHTINNLQYLTCSENRKKHNKCLDR